MAEQHRAEQRSGHADQRRYVAHQRRDQGDEGGGDGEIQAQVFDTGNAAAKQDAGEGEQVPGDIEGQADAEGVPAVEVAPVVLAGEGEELVGEQEAQADPPASRQRRQDRPQAHAVEQVLRGQEEGGEDDRKEPGTALEHADRHQLGGAGEDDGGQALALGRGEVGFDGHRSRQQPPGRDGQGQWEDGDGAAEKGLAGQVVGSHGGMAVVNVGPACQQAHRAGLNDLALRIRYPRRRKRPVSFLI